MTDYGALLRDHVTLRCRPIDRIFLQAYVRKLQSLGDVCIFLRWQRDFPIPSSAAFGRIGDEYVKAVYRFAEARGIPVVHFKKGEKKEEEIARPYLETAAREGKDRVVLIGGAQERASVWRSWPRKGQEKAEAITNRQLVERVAALLHSPYSSRQATYDLRRLKRKGLIAKVARANRYQLTTLGRRVAVLFTKTYGRVLAPGLSTLDPGLPDDVKARSGPSTGWRCLEKALDDFMLAALVPS